MLMASHIRAIFLMQSCLTLQMLQLAEFHENALVSVKPPKRPSIKERKQKLLTFLQGIFVLFFGPYEFTCQ